MTVGRRREGDEGSRADSGGIRSEAQCHRDAAVL